MNIEEIMVQNVKCGGCASNIKNGLASLSGVDSVDVDINTGKVEVHGDSLQRETLVKKLHELGYPEN